jgi:hypothetical protein
MNDEDLMKVLQSTLRSEQSPELTDAVVDAFLSIPVECSPEQVERMRARFVEKMFGELHREPVRQIEEKWPFGRWVEAIRESLRLTRVDIAVALRKDVTFVARLEKGETLPWHLKPQEIGDLICLLRIHMDAVLQLLTNSATASNTTGLGPVVARSRSGHMSDERGDATKKALDLYLARNTKPAALSEEARKWTDLLRQDLQRRQATYLLQ